MNIMGDRIIAIGIITERKVTPRVKSSTPPTIITTIARIGVTTPKIVRNTTPNTNRPIKALAMGFSPLYY